MRNVPICIISFFSEKRKLINDIKAKKSYIQYKKNSASTIKKYNLQHGPNIGPIWRAGWDLSCQKKNVLGAKDIGFHCREVAAVKD